MGKNHSVTLLGFFFMHADVSTVGKKDLLIVGPGVLGRIVAELWKRVSLEF